MKHWRNDTKKYKPKYSEENMVLELERLSNINCKDKFLYNYVFRPVTNTTAEAWKLS